MTEFFTLFSSAIISFLTHHWSERFLKRAQKNPRIILKNRQIHHSFWAIIVIAIGFIFTGGYYLLAMIGYSLGNLFQHKLSHNRVGEPGFVFVSKIK